MCTAGEVAKQSVGTAKKTEAFSVEKFQKSGDVLKTCAGFCLALLTSAPSQQEGWNLYLEKGIFLLL